MPGVTRVVVSANSIRDYQFLIPASCLLWRERIGFEPVAMLTGDWSGAAARHGIALRALEAFGIETHRLPPADGYTDVTLAQNCREVAAALPFPAETWLMPSDADIWPIRRDWYRVHEGRDGGAVAYYANGDHYQSYPTCHVTLKAKDWRRAYNIQPDGDVSGAVKRTLDLWKADPSSMYAKFPDKGFNIWMSDQWMIKPKLEAADIPVFRVERPGHPPVDRLCRSAWPRQEYDVVNYIDSHVPRPADQGLDTGFHAENWWPVRELFRRLLPGRAAWFEEYRERFVRGY